MMRILIAGTNGQLGNELVNILNCGEAEIGAIPQSYKDVTFCGMDVNKLDITILDEVEKRILEFRPNTVINCAAMTNVDACETNEKQAHEINAIGPKNIAIASQKIGAKFIQVSTDYVFSGDNNKPYRESDEVNPQTVYGKTKLLGEQQALENCEKTFVVRTAWLYGYEGNNFVKTISRIAKENGTIKVVNDQFGNPTSANDLAYEILRIALTDNYGVYHCTNEGVCTWYDFACAIVDGFGIKCTKIPCTTEEFPRPAKRPSFSALENKHLSETIGNEMRSWRQALSQYIDNVRTGNE